jgi:ubiquinol-cytochrome c reductase cytochrome b subunit
MRGVISQFATWVDNRTGLQTAISHFLFEDIPASAGWPHVFGSVALFLFLVQSLTGILLALNYAPTAGEAYSSLAYIVQQVAGGRLIHGLHHWGASAMIIVVVLHMAQVFIYGAFRKPREATWIAGVALLLLTLAFGLSGYLLPWDNKAYWGTMVTIRIADSLPFGGPFLARLAGATNGIGSLTFARFYAFHTLVLPAVAIGLTAVHVYLVRRHGITPNALEKGAPQKFYPTQLFRDSFTIFIAFICLFLAAAFLNVPLERMADPTDTEYVPRPEWYFLFLFQLLKIFPGRLELLATVVLPTVTIAVLILLPFLHRVNATILKGKIQSACVVALVFSMWLGLTSAAGWPTPHSRQNDIVSAQQIEWARNSPEVISGSGFFRSLHCDSCHDLIVGNPKPGPTLGLSGIQHTRDWVLAHLNEHSKGHPDGIDAPSLSVGQRNTLLIFVASIKPESLQTLSEMSPHFINGAQVFVNNACASCHKVNGVGGDIGPSLNGLANRRNVGWVAAHFAAPRKLSPGSVMPPYHFADKDQQDLIAYLFSLSQ